MRKRQYLLVTLARRIYGDLAARIMEELLNSTEITDEQLAQKLGVEVNTARRVLNELYESRLVMYRRVRDVEQGWYLYYWRATDEDPVKLVRERLRKTISVLEAKLRNESNTDVFQCMHCGSRFTFDEVADYMFHCPRCGEILEVVDNKSSRARLENAIERLRRLVRELEAE